MKVAILGYGVEGKSAYRYWSKLGAEVTICDSNADLELPEGVGAKLGVDYRDDLDEYDLLVRSPGVRPDLIKSNVTVTSVTCEFMAKCPAPIIGVTGTKGKGTTSTLIAKMLQTVGKTVWLGGNIGTPALDFLDSVNPDDYVVLELSSFQLMDVTQSPQIGVCLMIASDHMDYHVSAEEYIEAKGNIFRYQASRDIAVFNGIDAVSCRLAGLSPGKRIGYGTPKAGYVENGKIMYQKQFILDVSQVGLIGKHNLENVCAAVSAVYELLQDPKAIARAIREFKGLEHRLEEVRVWNEVRFINDSFAANPVAAMAALAAFEGPKVVVLGGFERGIDQTELIQAVTKSNVRQAILIGQTAEKLAKLMDEEGFGNYQIGPSDMGQIVQLAVDQAKSGDIVLLSPGSPSFDMFKNFADRGEQFKAAVMMLEEDA